MQQVVKLCKLSSEKPSVEYSDSWMKKLCIVCLLKNKPVPIYEILNEKKYKVAGVDATVTCTALDYKEEGKQFYLFLLKKLLYNMYFNFTLNIGKGPSKTTAQNDAAKKILELLSKA